MRWLRRLWEGLRRVLRGEVWDASPLSPGEAEIEAEMTALEERVRLLFEEVRGMARTVTEGKVVQTGEKFRGGESELRKASEERDDVSETASYPPAPFLKEGGERQRQETASCPPAPFLEEAGEQQRQETASYPPAPFLEEAGEQQRQETASCSPAPLLGDSSGDVGEEPRVVLRGVPQGICGQMTGRAGGARFWEGVL